MFNAGALLTVLGLIGLIVSYLLPADVSPFLGYPSAVAFVFGVGFMGVSMFD